MQGVDLVVLVISQATVLPLQPRAKLEVVDRRHRAARTPSHAFRDSFLRRGQLLGSPLRLSKSS